MRTKYTFNTDWQFTKPGEPPQVVALPHTWNAKDGTDGRNDYFRGTCTYTKEFAAPVHTDGEEVWLEFEGAAMTAVVSLNGKILARHAGGYSTFRVNLTPALAAQNTLTVAVDNSGNRTVYPQKADFTFYGGLYRDVHMLIVPQSHFALDNHGAPALRVTPKVADDLQSAVVTIEAACESTPDGTEVLFTVEGVGKKRALVQDGKAVAVFDIENVHLWDGVADLTGGKINIAMGSVLGIWHDHREAAEKNASEADNTLPTQEQLEAAAQHCDINDLVIDEEAKTVYLSDPEMSLDVGSVGKGYAVEMVCRAAEARGLTSALVSVGGNLRAIGTKPDGSQWTGGVENPWNASEVYTSNNSIFGSPINMSDLALVTSGDYQRYFVVDGKRYHHIIDPDTLWPAAYYNGVTVLCPDSGMADCLTTALFCMPLEEGQKLVESLDGVEAMWCTPDQQATTSSGWDSHLKK